MVESETMIHPPLFGIYRVYAYHSVVYCIYVIACYYVQTAVILSFCDSRANSIQH